MSLRILEFEDGVFVYLDCHNVYWNLKKEYFRILEFQTASNISFWATVNQFFQSPTCPVTQNEPHMVYKVIYALINILVLTHV